MINIDKEILTDRGDTLYLSFDIGEDIWGDKKLYLKIYRKTYSKLSWIPIFKFKYKKLASYQRGIYNEFKILKDVPIHTIKEMSEECIEMFYNRHDKQVKNDADFKDWDGLVGNIPDDARQSIIREKRLKKLLQK